MLGNQRELASTRGLYSSYKVLESCQASLDLRMSLRRFKRQLQLLWERNLAAREGINYLVFYLLTSDWSIIFSTMWTLGKEGSGGLVGHSLLQWSDALCSYRLASLTLHTPQVAAGEVWVHKGSREQNVIQWTRQAPVWPQDGSDLCFLGPFLASFEPWKNKEVSD